MFHRHLSSSIMYASQKFPVVTLTGPRQSGKTTLVRSLFPQKAYVSLEDIDHRAFATYDPRGFLNNFPDGAILDEVHHVPNLLSYIQTRVDQNLIMGEFILTGSQNLLLSEKVSQTLAGRASILQLLPCSVSELEVKEDLFSLLYKGFYPAVHDRDIDPVMYYKSYTQTYVERDVKSMINIKDWSKFHLFLQLCAGRIGQVFNSSNIAADCGVHHATIQSWISILEASYILFRLQPHNKKFNKRLIKHPKLYFYDTGLAANLLGIESPETLSRHFIRGPIFENYIAAELIKGCFNKGLSSNIYFWRDNHGKEMDFIIDHGSRIDAVEVKSTATLTQSLFDGLNYWHHLSPESHRYLIYGGDMEQKRSDIQVLPWKKAVNVLMRDEMIL